VPDAQGLRPGVGVEYLAIGMIVSCNFAQDFNTSNLSLETCKVGDEMISHKSVIL